MLPVRIYAKVGSSDLRLLGETELPDKATSLYDTAQLLQDIANAMYEQAELNEIEANLLKEFGA